MFGITLSATQLPKCILLHAYLRASADPSCASTNKNFVKLI